MILRNRNLNVQQKDGDDAAGQQQQKRKGSSGGGFGPAAVKRQAAHLIIKEEAIKEPQKDEPKPKRTCHTHSNSIVQDFTNTLCINSAKRQSFGIDKNRGLPEPVVFEFDQETATDMTAVPEYVQDIFNYYKHRERFFRVGDYLGRQPNLNFLARANIVNWMVELQETFELNHETLYLGVKLFDMFIDRTPSVPARADLQLIASAAVFIASKYDERAPPLIDDFIYMSQDGFSQDQMMAMERQMLRVVQFDLGAPLSYRFLRRYARVARDDMGTLTLARYALELSLMSSRFCRMSESKIAAAALLLAKRMKSATSDVFLDVLQKCSGYPVDELLPLMWELNRMLIKREQMFGRQNDNVFRKYSHEIFFEVAKIPPLP